MPYQFHAASNVQLSHTSKSGGESAGLNVGSSVSGGVPAIGGFSMGMGGSASTSSDMIANTGDSDNTVSTTSGVAS